jgi:hypothetical protein
MPCALSTRTVAFATDSLHERSSAERAYGIRTAHIPSWDGVRHASQDHFARERGRGLGVTLLFVTYDIDEAIYLGQKVVALSSTPTRVLETLPVDLPDDRDQLTTRPDVAFADLRGHVYAQVQRARA